MNKDLGYLGIFDEDLAETDEQLGGVADQIDGHYGQTCSPNTHLSLPHILSRSPHVGLVGELGVDADVEPDEDGEGDDGDQENVEHQPDRGDCLILPPLGPDQTRLNTQLSRTEAKPQIGMHQMIFNSLALV